MMKTQFVRLAVVAAVSFMFAASTASAALVSHWKFDEGSGQTAADSVGTNNGTLGLNASVSTDDPTWSAGKIGTGSLNFDGADDFVEIGSPASLNVSAVTMSAWVNIDTAKRNAVFDKESNSSAGNGLHMRVGVNTSDTQLRGYVGNTGASDFTTSTGSLALGQWTHVALVSDGTYIQTYINGVADGFATLSSGIFNNSISFRIGGSDIAGPSMSLDGRIDDGGFWNSTLNGAQVTSLYSLGNSSLGYNVSQAQQLFDLYNAATGSTTIDGRVWTYTTGLSLGLGTVAETGSGYFLQLNVDGTGLMSLSAPEPSSFLLLGVGLVALRSTRRSRRACVTSITR